MSKEIIELRCEPCPICKGKRRILLTFHKAKLKPDVTGTVTIADLHGIKDEDNPHVRLLYVDANGSVRSFRIIDNLTGMPTE